MFHNKQVNTPLIKTNAMTKIFKKYLKNLLESLPLAIIISCISVLILTNMSYFQEFDLKIVFASFAITILIMSHLIKPFAKIVEKI